MGFRRLRDRLAGRALAVALTAVVAGSALSWGHAGDDDAACNPVAVQHDRAAHRFTAHGHDPVRPPDHCIICHTLRALHAALTAQASAAAPDLQSTPAESTSPSVARAIGHTARASRAPPAVLL